ncbi:MAG: Si-specific NAD(P)(+) transhydrogenase [Acidobacteriota bacterium]
MPDYDVVILGGGPAGERAAIQAARAHKRVALVERQHVVGGTRINWGTIPSKTLRESALFVASLTRHKLHGIRCEMAAEVTVAELMYRERLVVQRELELVNASLARYAVEVIHGHGRFEDPHTVAVLGKDGMARLRLRGEVIVIATGTRPNRPPQVPFDGERVFDSDTILALPRVPRSMIVLGAGVIGVEYASIFAALGLEVTLIDTRPQLLPYLDREMAALLERELRRLGIILIHDDHFAAIESCAGPPARVCCSTRRGERLEADVLLYCVGRDGNTDDLGLANIGLQPNQYGLLTVNENFQTAIPHIYAVGDVIGYPALASTSMEQGRQAIRHAFGIPGPRGRTEELPFAIYSIPEVAFIGKSEEALGQEGCEVIRGYGRYDYNPRGQIIGDEGGRLKLLFAASDLTLRGVHIVGTGASELIHIGQAFLKSRATARDIAETLYNYPTLSDLYRHAALEALGAHLRRRVHGDPEP